MSLVGGAPSGTVAAEDVRHFELWTGHRQRVIPALSLPCSGVRAGSEPAGSCRRPRGRAAEQRDELPPSLVGHRAPSLYGLLHAQPATKKADSSMGQT
jgi:hypothetical protein